MISKFKKHRRTIRPPFNAENLFLLGIARMMFWKRSLKQKIVKHKRGSRSRRAQQHAVALEENCVPLDKDGFETRLYGQDGVFSDPLPTSPANAVVVYGTSEEKSVPMDEVGFETRLHRRDGVFSDPPPTSPANAAVVHGTSEEKSVPMDEVGFETRFHRRDGVLSDPHPKFGGEVGSGDEEMDVVSTPRCSKSIVEPRVDSPGAYRSTATSVRASFTDAAIEEMQALLDFQQRQLNKQRELNERLQKEIDSENTWFEIWKQERDEIVDEIDTKNMFLNVFIESFRISAVRSGWYKIIPQEDYDTIGRSRTTG